MTRIRQRYERNPVQGMEGNEKGEGFCIGIVIIFTPKYLSA